MKVLWLKTWQRNNASKVKLCGIPLAGDLFGPRLEIVLDRTADKQYFPVGRRVSEQVKLSCPQKTFQGLKGRRTKEVLGSEGHG